MITRHTETIDANEVRSWAQKKITEFNIKQTGRNIERHEFVLSATNDVGERVGTLIARTSAGTGVFVELLYVDERARGTGVGAKLMAEVEDLARKVGCDLVYLNTFSFQAPNFYEKLGYQKCGVIDDYPKGHTRLFYVKRV